MNREVTSATTFPSQMVALVQQTGHSERTVISVILKICEVGNPVSIEGARSCGYDLAHDYPDKLIAMTATLPDYQPSIYLDHARHRPMELDAIFAAPLEAVQAAGGAMPRIEAFYRALRFIDARNVVGEHECSSLE